MGKRKPTIVSDKKKLRPALTSEAREERCIGLAYDLVEQRLIDGTATSQETTHFLRLGCIKGRAETEKVKRENEVLMAKAEQLKSATRIEELYSEAIKAMQSYQGMDNRDEDV